MRTLVTLFIAAMALSPSLFADLWFQNPSYKHAAELTIGIHTKHVVRLAGGTTQTSFTYAEEIVTVSPTAFYFRENMSGGSYASPQMSYEGYIYITLMEAPRWPDADLENRSAPNWDSEAGVYNFDFHAVISGVMSINRMYNRVVYEEGNPEFFHPIIHAAREDAFESINTSAWPYEVELVWMSIYDIYDNHPNWPPRSPDTSIY